MNIKNERKVLSGGGPRQADSIANLFTVRSQGFGLVFLQTTEPEVRLEVVEETEIRM